MDNIMDNTVVRITKRFTFEACHNLVNYEGPCHRLHGHSYKLYVTVRRFINPNSGMVMDFKTLKSIVNTHVIDKVDHQNLNEIMPEEFQMSPKDNTTCENMLVAFWVALDHSLLSEGVTLDKLKLYETEDSYAEIDRRDIYNG